MVRLENIKIREELETDEVMRIACKKNHIELSDVEQFYIFKKSIDARNKDDIFYNYTIDIAVKNENKYKKLKNKIFDKCVIYKNKYVYNIE